MFKSVQPTRRQSPSVGGGLAGLVLQDQPLASSGSCEDECEADVKPAEEDIIDETEDIKNAQAYFRMKVEQERKAPLKCQSEEVTFIDLTFFVTCLFAY